jgi:outer membrane protein assembly factor BamE
VQGNVVTKDRPRMVKPGMTREQVRDMLGSPLLTDPFHADRWDYVFTIRRQGVEPQRRSVVVWFEGEAESAGGARPAGGDDFVHSAVLRSRPRGAEPRAGSHRRAEARPCRCRPPAETRRRRPSRLNPGAARTYPPLEPA